MVFCHIGISPPPQRAGYTLGLNLDYAQVSLSPPCASSPELSTAHFRHWYLSLSLSRSWRTCHAAFPSGTHGECIHLLYIQFSKIKGGFAFSCFMRCLHYLLPPKSSSEKVLLYTRHSEVTFYNQNQKIIKLFLLK